MQRQCGDCQLCCRLVPTKDIGKPANTKCRHQCRGGCAIYERRPFSCRTWSCQWLLGMDVGRRPDRSHLVVDPVPDYVTAVNNETGARTPIAVVQVWCDPEHPDAHRDPAFRRWLDACGAPALLRFGSVDGMMLVPPSNPGSGGQWIEYPRKPFDDGEHGLVDTLASCSAISCRPTGSWR